MTGLGGMEHREWRRGARVVGDLERMAEWVERVVRSEESEKLWLGGE